MEKSEPENVQAVTVSRLATAGGKAESLTVRRSPSPQANLPASPRPTWVATTTTVQLVGLGNYTHPGTRHNVGMMVLNAISHQHRLQWQDQRSVKGLTATLTESVVSKPSTPAHGKRRKETPAEREKRILDQLRAQIHSEFATGALDESAPLEPASSLRASPPPESAVEPQPVVEPVRWEITLLKPRVLMNISGVSVAKAVAELGIPVENVLVIHDDMQRDLGKVALKHGGSANGHNGIKSIIDHLRTNAFRRLRIGIGRPLQDDRSRDLVSDFVLGKFTPAERETLENVTYQTCLQQWPGLFLPSDDNRT